MNDANPRWQNAQGGPDNERDPYAEDPYYQQQYGYDAYGRPLPSQQVPQQPQPPQQQAYQAPYYADPTQTYGGQQPDGQSAGWIPQQPQQPYFGQQAQQGQQGAPGPHGYTAPPSFGGAAPGGPGSYDTGQQPVFDTGQHAVYETGQQPVFDTGQHALYETGQQPVFDTGQQAIYSAGPSGRRQTGPAAGPAAGARREAAADTDVSDAPNYQTEQFAFVDEESEESEEVIDWLKFSESRTERREEARRRGRNRKVWLVAVVVLALLGAGGYLWQSGRIPGLGKDSKAQAASGGPQKRDVIVVHLLPVSGGESATALLVDNATKGRGTTVLIPNSLQLSSDDGSAASLDKAVADGVGPTRDSLNTLLGTDIKGSWRLDSPYLELLVDSLGDVFVDTDTNVKGTGTQSGTTLVHQGKQQELTGQDAVAYATYKGPGESQSAQLARFGQVMQALLKKFPSDAAEATRTVQGLGQILDPSLTDAQLGATLAQLAELAKTGGYDTTTLQVQQDGTLGAQSVAGVVKDVLGGNVKQSTGTTQPRVQIQDATGVAKAAGIAQAAIVNGGTYVSVPGGKASGTQAASQVLYADPAKLAAAKDVAATLGLPETAVKKGTVPSNTDISVILGKDYKLPSP